MNMNFKYAVKRVTKIIHNDNFGSTYAKKKYAKKDAKRLSKQFGEIKRDGPDIIQTYYEVISND